MIIMILVAMDKYGTVKIPIHTRMDKREVKLLPITFFKKKFAY